jgi:hypothetical protein
MQAIEGVAVIAAGGGRSAWISTCEMRDLCRMLRVVVPVVL